jgi:hypothetical protein
MRFLKFLGRLIFSYVKFFGKVSLTTAKGLKVITRDEYRLYNKGYLYFPEQLIKAATETQGPQHGPHPENMFASWYDENHKLLGHEEGDTNE